MGDEIRTYLPLILSEDFADKKLRSKVTTDMIACYYEYGASPAEYFLCEFRNLPSSRRSEFLTNEYKDEVMIRKVGLGEKWDMLENKLIFHELFGNFFHRDVCPLTSSSDKEKFLDFCSKHNRFIVKPIDGQCGKGVKVISQADAGMSASILFDGLLKEGKYIVEELIKQSGSMSQWNKTSVNTVRIPSFMNNSGFHVLKPFIRFGRAGAVVDNGNSGGVFAVVDSKTGRLETDGCDMKKNTYAVHPDSGLTFKGWQVPHWQELLELAKEVHSTIPDYPYIGWDFALTDEGWVLIEGNWGEFLSEFADKEGIKKKFDSLFD